MQNNLPFLPGYSFEDHSFKQKHHKQHVFDYKNGVATVFGAPSPSKKIDDQYATVAKELVTLQMEASKNLGESMTSEEPTWISLERKVLRFYGYFKEAVTESAKENFRVRRVVIFFHLEDDTVHVSEQKQDNSGIMQGGIIKRHRIPFPEKGKGEYYGVKDFHVGKSVSLYGKTIMIVDCDKFTREFLTELKADVPEAIPYPKDSFELVQEQKQEETKPVIHLNPEDRHLKRYLEYSFKGRHTAPSKAEQKLAQSFLQKDRQVLRFYAVWDNREVLYGEVRSFVIEYYLAEDRIKFSEKYPPNSGRDPFPVFIKKAKFQKPEGGVYTDADLKIGGHIVAYNKKFLIYDCDDFTKQYYTENHGITDFTPIDVQAIINNDLKKLKEDEKIQKKIATPPPYNGFGDEEDSLSSWKFLVLHAPVKDVAKFIAYDKINLRFKARMVTNKPEDVDRSFIITYFLSDDTIAVYEPPIRNSGVIGGKFLQRQKVKKPTGDPYAPKDFFVGATIILFAHEFELIGTDQFTLKLMESRPKEFNMSDINNVLKKFRELIMDRHEKARDAFREIDLDHSGTITLDELQDLLKRLNLQMSDQEVLTIMRYFDEDGDGEITFQEFKETVFPCDFTGVQTFKPINDPKELTVDQNFKDNIMSTKKKREQEFAQKYIFKKFKLQVEMKRLLFQETFRIMSERRSDGMISQEEFKKALVPMQLALNDNEIQALIEYLFQGEKMLTMNKFVHRMDVDNSFEKRDEKVSLS